MLAFGVFPSLEVRIGVLVARIVLQFSGALLVLDPLPLAAVAGLPEKGLAEPSEELVGG